MAKAYVKYFLAWLLKTRRWQEYMRHSKRNATRLTSNVIDTADIVYNRENEMLRFVSIFYFYTIVSAVVVICM